MIRFDSNSIYNRILDKLQQDPNWKVLINNSVITSLVKSNAEADSEIARYIEYLFKESRWDTAQNPSSVLSMANMMGYQPKRKISARGKVYVSTSPTTHLVGKTISYESFLSLKDKIVVDETSSFAPNTGDNISLNSACNVTCGNKHFIITKPAVLENGDYYASIDVMEGVKKTHIITIDTIRATATFSKIDPYLYIPVMIKNCEDASNLSSIPFLRVVVVYKTDRVDEYGNPEADYREYRIVDSLLLSSSSDFDCELYNDLYNQNLFYLKFNNDLYNGNVIDISSSSPIDHIRIDYVESSGSEGNIEDLYSNFSIIASSLNSATGKSVSRKLYGINYTPITGGYDEETVSDIKKNTVKSYTKYFGIGTQEAYEKAIENTEIKVSINGTEANIKPSKVHVFGGYYTDSFDTRQYVTYVSFIGSGLEDLEYETTSTNPYMDVEKALNHYLSRLKSPQDIIKFTPPEYISFSVGLNCKIANSTEYELTALQNSICDYIDSIWGPNSDSINFGNNFIQSQLVSLVMKKFTDVVSIKVSVEAVSRLKWDNAILMTPKTDENGVIHTCRIPFDFSSVFLGDTSTTPGFKDHRSGANYVMRIDLMYKKPIHYQGINVDLHKSIFIKENRERSMDSTGFYTIQASNQIIWTGSSDTIGEENYSDYSELLTVDKLETAYQVDYESKVFDDSDFITLENEIKNGIKPTRTSITSAGALDNYIVYFSGDYSQDSENIGYGWFEFTFDEIYSVLSYFSNYDPTLRKEIAGFPLASLKCGVANDSVFRSFIESVSKYVDIYVSMRPVEEDLVLSSVTNGTNVNNSNKVLYIDSYDTKVLSDSNNVNNLTIYKKSRFIDIDCYYEDI